MTFASLPFATAFLSLFQKNAEPETPAEAVLEDDDKTEWSRIRCPLCRWKPQAHSRWHCGNADDPEYFYNGCGTAWNTFDTRGLCPGCGHQWRWTACPACWQWSLHEDWYATEPDE